MLLEGWSRGPAAWEPPRILWEVCILWPYLRPTESESRRWRPAICVLKILQVSFMNSEVWEGGGREEITFVLSPSKFVFLDYSQREEGIWQMVPICMECPRMWQNLWGEALGTDHQVCDLESGSEDPGLWVWLGKYRHHPRICVPRELGQWASLGRPSSIKSQRFLDHVSPGFSNNPRKVGNISMDFLLILAYMEQTQFSSLSKNK